MSFELNFKAYFFGVLLVFLTGKLNAQIDKEFWFAAPELQEMHGDDPIVLRMTAQDKPVNVTISMPANPAFKPISVSMNANTSKTVDLSAFKSIIENTEKNIVSKRGIYISGNESFSCYYDIPDPYNGDLFSLKGKNAQGFQFTVPLQRRFLSYGYPNYTADFIILATENNTTVTITPTQKILGHDAGKPFSIVLNKGETFVCQNASNTPEEKPGGSKVVSDKKIVITIKDDSLYYPGYSCGDTAGDQLIPDELAGLNFIVIKGRLYAEDYYYVYAIEDSTRIRVNSIVVATLQSGQYYLGKLSEPTCYIESEKPVQLFHLTGFGCELGGAILPPLRCTGSGQLSVTRATAQDFFFNILAPSEIVGSFKFNNTNELVDSSKFSTVPFTNGEWKFARITIPYAKVAAGEVAKIENQKGKFHVGVIHGDQGSTTRYGYFSDFSSTTITYRNYFPPFCLGEPVSRSPILIVTATNALSYQWYRNKLPSNKGGTPIVGATDSTYTVPLDNNVVGTTYYYVEVKGVCGNVTSAVTPIVIAAPTIVTANIAQPADVCIGDSIPQLAVAASGEGTLSYQWYESLSNSYANATLLTGAQLPSFTPTQTTVGKKYYFAIVSGTCGKDTSNIISLRLKPCGDPSALEEEELGKTYKIYVPNTFTPNGDGRNDVFKVYGDYQEAKLLVYNQWGQLIFSGSGATGWDGRYKGVLQPVGTYVFIAEIVLPDGSKISKKGVVNLIK